jgi:hypothetical protein
LAIALIRLGSVLNGSVRSITIRTSLPARRNCRALSHARCPNYRYRGLN